MFLGSTTEKTMTLAKMRWMVKQGFAWRDAEELHLEELDGECRINDTHHTRQESYAWHPMRQLYVSY